ncbi:MAG: AI-2E family transporter [Verrucomicrobiota bacterium]|nr:AI-2E family transporter [Verrucomicrobiota bacterium]
MKDLIKRSSFLNPLPLSYIVIVVMLLLVGWLHLATPLLTVLFAYFALTKLHVFRNKWITIVIFSLLVSSLLYGFGYFVKQALKGLPEIAHQTVLHTTAYAEKHNLELPFTDVEGLKALAMDKFKGQYKMLGSFAKTAAMEIALLLIGCVVAASVFKNPQLDLERGSHRVRNNLYSLTCDQVVRRFRGFYQSFATVMGAQITISAINTVLTSIFVFAVGLPYAVVIVGVTFLCGLLPIIGNILSNTVIVAIAFTVSPQLAVASLVFLVVLHKMEYFLNSKIIGERIKNPVWLTLLGLVLGERLMGIPGMILAPVVLHYIKVESSRIEVQYTAPIDDENELPVP